MIKGFQIEESRATTSRQGGADTYMLVVIGQRNQGITDRENQTHGSGLKFGLVAVYKFSKKIQIH
jgi:hypothetical protein